MTIKQICHHRNCFLIVNKSNADGSLDDENNVK